MYTVLMENVDVYRIQYRNLTSVFERDLTANNSVSDLIYKRRANKVVLRFRAIWERAAWFRAIPQLSISYLRRGAPHFILKCNSKVLYWQARSAPITHIPQDTNQHVRELASADDGVDDEQDAFSLSSDEDLNEISFNEDSDLYFESDSDGEESVNSDNEEGEVEMQEAESEYESEDEGSSGQNLRSIVGMVLQQFRNLRTSIGLARAEDYSDDDDDDINEPGFPAAAGLLGSQGIDPELLESLPTFLCDSDALPKENASCSICLSEYSSGEILRTLPCMHYLHQECIDRWLHQNNTCPICKFVVDEHESTDSNLDTISSIGSEEQIEEEEEEDGVESPPHGPVIGHEEDDYREYYSNYEDEDTDEEY